MISIRSRAALRIEVELTNMLIGVRYRLLLSNTDAFRPGFRTWMSIKTYNCNSVNMNINNTNGKYHTI